MARIIFLLLCMVTGAVTGFSGITVSDWQYWALLGCVAGAYACGWFVE